MAAIVEGLDNMSKADIQKHSVSLNMLFNEINKGKGLDSTKIKEFLDLWNAEDATNIEKTGTATAGVVKPVGDVGNATKTAAGQLDPFQQNLVNSAEAYAYFYKMVNENPIVLPAANNTVSN